MKRVRTVDPFTSRITRRTLVKTAILAGASSAFAPGLLKTASAGRSKTEVTSWCVAGPRFEIPQKALIPLFKKKHPDIDIKVITSPWGEFYQKVSIALGGGAAQYDTIFHDYAVVPAQASAGWLTPLDEFLDKDPAFKKDILADIPPNVIDLYRHKGALYGLPPDANLQLMYWRRDVFEKRGIKPPDTWDDVLNAAKELTGGGQYGFAASLQRGVWAESLFVSMLWSYGGDIYDVSTFKVMVDSEVSVKVLNLMKDLMKYADPVTLNATNDEVIRSFSGGRAVLAPCEWGGAGFTDKKFNKFADATGVKRVPAGTGPGSGHIPIMGGLGFTIPVKSTKKSQAWTWIRFVLSNDRDVQDTWVKNSGQPTRLSVLKRWGPKHALYGPLAESLPIARPYPRIPEGQEVIDKIGTEVSLVITGQKPPEKAVKDMDKQLNDLFKKARYLK